MVPQDTGWWWFWGKGLTQKGSAFLVDSFSPVISLCSFDVLGTSQDVGDGNNRPRRPCAEQTWGGKMQRTVQPCITEEFSSHSRAQCFSGARQASGQGRMCVHPRVSIYTGTAVFFIISPGKSEVHVCDKHFSVLLELPSRDRSPCSESHREETINQSVYMALAAFEAGLGAFVLYRWLHRCEKPKKNLMTSFSFSENSLFTFKCWQIPASSCFISA